MKKNCLLGVLTLCVMTLLTGCDPVNQTSGKGKLTGLTVKPESITLATGENVRLATLTTPENIKVDIAWSSSDENVAVVDGAGVVTAVGIGEATVTAKAGDCVGTCRVTVQSYLETLQFTQAIVWDHTILDSTEVSTIEASDGTEYKAYLAETTYRLFSAGFYINGDGYLDGASDGAVVDIIAPMWYAPKELNDPNGQNIVFSLGEWIIEASQERKHHIAQPGEITDVYLPSLLSFVEKYNTNDETWQDDVINAYQNGYKGTVLYNLYYDCDDPSDDSSCGYGYANAWGIRLPNAIVTAGSVYADGKAAGSSVYMTVLNYSNLTLRELAGDWGGLDVEMDPETSELSLNSNNLLLGNEFTIEQGTMPAEVKGTMLPVPFVMTKDYPEVAKRVDEQLKGYKQLRIKK